MYSVFKNLVQFLNNYNFSFKFLEQSRRYLICLLLLCPHFSLNRNKNDMSAFSHVSSHSPYRYLGDNHYSFFKNHRSLGGVFPFILMGTFSSDSSTSPVCVSGEYVCIASARVPDIIARVKSSWPNWRKNTLQLDLDLISFTCHRQCIIQNVGNLVGLLHGCSSISVYAAILSSFTL